MTVGELIAMLTEVEPHLPVILQKDAEGNGYSPLAGGEEACYEPDTEWSGEVFNDEMNTNCVVLWPMH